MGLDFAYLQELSRLDVKLRYLIFRMCLDIEHYAKVKLLKDVNNTKSDGYKIVDSFVLEVLYQGYNIIDSIQGKANKAVCKGLVDKFINEFAIWNIVEVISFSDLIRLLEFYYKPKHGDIYELFHCVRFLRNAAAHNNCLLNSLRRPYEKHALKSRIVQDHISFWVDTNEFSRSKESVKKKLDNPVIHDFVALLVLYHVVIKSESTKAERIRELKELFFEIMPRHKEYFVHNDAIISSYEFIVTIIDKLC